MIKLPPKKRKKLRKGTKTPNTITKTENDLEGGRKRGRGKEGRGRRRHRKWRGAEGACLSRT